MSPPRADQLLGEAGPLSECLPGYELRPGQLLMARAVQSALERGAVLLCEAGTGTGKTLAYLLPAILSGKKVVVSTATRALQEQIFNKDLPLIEAALGLRTRAALVKGLGNYVCRRRLAQFRRSVDALQHTLALRELDSWLAESETGDIAEAAMLAENDAVWPEVVASSDTRVGASCPHYEECFVSRMRREAEAARLVVVNHHLFFADLALRGPHPGHVLPDYEAVVFDEAHQLEDIATDFFGMRVSKGGLGRIGRNADRAMRAAASTSARATDPSGARLVVELASAAERFWSVLQTRSGGDTGRTTLDPDAWCGDLEQAWYKLDTACEALAAVLTSVAERLPVVPGSSPGGARLAREVRDELTVVARRAEQTRQQLAYIAQGRSGVVAWLDRSSRSLAVGASPVDLADMFRTQVFETVPSVVLTSATLAVDVVPTRSADEAGQPPPSPFDYLRSRLGLDQEPAAIELTELVVPSPFDFATSALLYTPRDLPAPTASEFTEAATRRAAELAAISEGGAFVLTTSVRTMHELARGLRRRMPSSPLLVQGEAPKQALLAEFRDNPASVLVATMSFWEGVDVPGPALRLVILLKVPFPVPTDPIIRARSLSLEENGRSPFMQLHLPSAAIALKQGFGRLIRTQSDYGVVALFDSRLHRRGYGQRLLAALPPAKRTCDLARVREFFSAREARARQ